MLCPLSVFCDKLRKIVYMFYVKIMSIILTNIKLYAILFDGLLCSKKF